MPKEQSALMRVNLNPNERHQLKIKAAKANKPVSHFVADHLRESLRLNSKRNQPKRGLWVWPAK